MEKYWQRILLKWGLVSAIVGIEILSYAEMGLISLITLPLSIYIVINIIKIEVKKWKT